MIRPFVALGIILGISLIIANITYKPNEVKGVNGFWATKEKLMIGYNAEWSGQKKFVFKLYNKGEIREESIMIPVEFGKQYIEVENKFFGTYENIRLDRVEDSLEEIMK